MASAYGNVVQRWQSYIEASITSQTDTTATITLKVYFHSLAYGFKTHANADGTINGVKSAVANFSAMSGTGQTVNQLVVTHTVEVSKGSSDENVSVSGRVQLTGGFQNGTSTAYTTVSVPARTYYQPHHPKSFAAKRTSDTQMDLTWQGDYTGMDGGYPWTGVYVERRIDDGSWVSIATLDWDAVNYSDKTTDGNHKYEYRVQSYGPGGKSSYAAADPLYTTPAAPASVSLAKTTGTEVSLDVDASNAPYATSWDVQKSLNGGEWSDVGNYTTFPQTVDVGGGTAKLRVRSKREGLLSGWTESATITTIVAPNAPTLTTKPAAVIPIGEMMVVSWEPNHPDGSEQTAAQVGWTIGDDPEDIEDIIGDTTFASYRASFTGTVKIRVRTKGIAEDWGAWTSYYTVTVAVPPEAHFTTPGIDGAKIGDLPLVVEWSITDSTGVASQSLQLMDGSGKVLHSAAPSTGTRQYTFDASTYQLSNATDYGLRLTVRGGSSLTTTVARSFSTSFAEPARPDAGLSVDPSDLSAAVTVYAGSPSSDTGEVIEVPATPGTLVPGFTVYGNTRQNLWVNPATRTQNGISLTSNADGSFTLNGTASETSYFYTDVYCLKPGARYTLSLDRSVNANISVQSYGDSGYIADDIFMATGSTSVSGTVSQDATKFRLMVQMTTGTAVSGTYRIMLNEGSDAEPWCPPGLNSVGDDGSVKIVTAGKNLFDVSAGMNTQVEHELTVNGDGSFDIHITKDGWYSFSRKQLPVIHGAKYTISVNKKVCTAGNGFILDAMDYAGVNVNLVYDTNVGGSYGPELTKTWTCPDNISQLWVALWVDPSNPMPLSVSDVKVCVNIGENSEWAPYVPITTTPIDLDGHTLNSLPDGTRDELRIDGTGAVTLVQRVGSYVADGDEGWKLSASDDAPYRMKVENWKADVLNDTLSYNEFLSTMLPASGIDHYYNGSYVIINGIYQLYAGRNGITTADDFSSWLETSPMTVLYPLATPQEVDLPGIAMPAFPAAETQVFCASNVPCDVRVDYPDTESLSVTRVLADGSRWLVADGLTSGQQAIDPLPPLNADYSYEVTASTGAGAIVSATFAQRIDSRGRMALNFGAAASVAHVMGANAKVSYDESADGELYHFADGGESGGLPQFYGTGDIDASGSVSFELMDRGERDRFKRSARRYAVGWFRDAMGGRIRARMGYSESVKAGGIAVWEESVDMDEVIFEEAW